MYENAYLVYYMDNSVLPATKTLVFFTFSTSEHMEKLSTQCPGYVPKKHSVVPARFL